MADNAPVVEKPTYMANIRHFFTADDVAHMGARGYDLATYTGVKKNALQVFAHTGPNGDMPKDAPKWSANKHQTFRNWIATGYLQGTAVPQALPGMAVVAKRTRKNINSLSVPEIEKVKMAFNGLMARDPSENNSYFAIAGIHGLPQAWCSHHIDHYNPWHRVYLKLFEDALRSVPGCESVTLPYWDISTPLPQVLQDPPFARYELPRDPGASADPPQPGTFFPYTTQRYDPGTIEQELRGYGVLEEIATSGMQTMWGAYNTNGYQDFSIQAHDGGHMSIGPAMGVQEVAAFDPVFWFFHCNLDRLWLQWQQKVGATTLQGFMSTITGDTLRLNDPAFNPLKPFDITADKSIDLGIAYEEDQLLKSAAAMPLENTAGSIEATRTFTIKRKTPVSVRVKDIERLNIPGSFVVNLLADGKPIAKRAFFQPNAPQNCPNCRKAALVNIDFRIDPEKLFNRNLSVSIDVPSQAAMGGTRFPLSAAGNPTINVRLLLEEE